MDVEPHDEDTDWPPCPSWCVECGEDVPPGARYHQGTRRLITASGESGPVQLGVRPAHFDWSPSVARHLAVDNRPHVVIEVLPQPSDVTLTPSTAREYAAAILEAAATIDNGGHDVAARVHPT
jgi:hypothetical protein